MKPYLSIALLLSVSLFTACENASRATSQNENRAISANVSAPQTESSAEPSIEEETAVANVTTDKRTPKERAKDWELFKTPSDAFIELVAFGENGEIALVGNPIYLSLDSGENWTEIKQGKGYNRCTDDGGETFGCGSDKSLKIKNLTLNDIGNPQDAVLSRDGRLYVETFYDNTGGFWSIPVSNSEEEWYGMNFPHSKESDGSKYYIAQPMSVAGEIVATASRPLGMALVATADKGNSWYVLNQNVVGIVDFIEGNTGFKINNDGVEKTTDGGRNWQIVSYRPDLLNLKKDSASKFNGPVAVDFVNEETGFAAGFNGLLMTTKDGGLTWLLSDAETKNTLYKVAALDENHAWAVGEKGIVIETSDGGITWQQIDFGFGKDDGATLYDNSLRIDSKRKTVWILKDGKIFRKTVQ